MTAITNEAITKAASLPLGDNDAGAATVADYLRKLLAELWKDGEGFSGKRPFGNSGWEYDLYAPLIGAGLIGGKLDEDGYVEKCDTKAGEALVLAVIERMTPVVVAETP